MTSGTKEGMTLAGLLATLALGACVGTIGGTDEGAAPASTYSPQCANEVPGSAPLRRLTPAEYDRTVRDLLGDAGPSGSGLSEIDGVVTLLLAEQYMDAAEALAEAALGDLPALLGCDPSADPDACARHFVETFGKRAYRRPLAPEEIERHLSLFAWGAAAYGFDKGIALVVQAMLQSPHFLYRVELGIGESSTSPLVPLSAYEMASRLSYLLWGTMPDAELFAAADEGRLEAPDEIAAQARRLLDDPRAREALRAFHRAWLDLEALDEVSKDPALHPEFDAATAALLREESEAFVEHVVFDGSGDLAALFTATYSMMNAELAAYHGLSGPQGSAFEKVELDPARHAGLLTQASLLSLHAKPNRSSPVLRGKLVREKFLCQELPPPPDDVEVMPPALDPNATTRELFSEHATDPACSGCHQLMDPIGFGLEHYDAVGRWRDFDNGQPVDASGEILGSDGDDGTFDGAVELGAILASSERVKSCVVRRWFQHAYGRPDGAGDACTIDQLTTAFADSGGDIKELIVALTQTNAFRYRVAGGAKP